MTKHFQRSRGLFVRSELGMFNREVDNTATKPIIIIGEIATNAAGLLEVEVDSTPSGVTMVVTQEHDVPVYAYNSPAVWNADWATLLAKLEAAEAGDYKARIFIVHVGGPQMRREAWQTGSNGVARAHATLNTTSIERLIPSTPSLWGKYVRSGSMECVLKTTQTDEGPLGTRFRLSVEPDPVPSAQACVQAILGIGFDPTHPRWNVRDPGQQPLKPVQMLLLLPNVYGEGGVGWFGAGYGHGVSGLMIERWQYFWNSFANVIIDALRAIDPSLSFTVPSYGLGGPQDPDVVARRYLKQALQFVEVV